MAPPSSSTNRVTTKALLRSPLRQGLSAEGLQLVHGLVDPLFRHGVRGPQRLGEETDPQLLEHPPERLHVSTCTSCHRECCHEGVVLGLDASDGFHECCVAAHLRGRPITTHEYAAQVALDVAEPRNPCVCNKSRIQKRLQLSLHIGLCGSHHRAGHRGQCELDLSRPDHQRLDTVDDIHHPCHDLRTNDTQRLFELLRTKHLATRLFCHDRVDRCGKAVLQEIGDTAVRVVTPHGSVPDLLQDCLAAAVDSIVAEQPGG